VTECRKISKVQPVCVSVEVACLRASCFFSFCLAIAGIVTIETATAEDQPDAFAFFGESRLRLETAEQDNLPDKAAALTQLIRPALELRASDKLTALIEAEAVFAIVDDFDDGSGNNPGRPVIADPDGLELNRLQLQYSVGPRTFITLGRQKLALDDERFLGPGAFRQNDQTYDGVHISTQPFGTTTFQAGYFGKVHRVLGSDNPIGAFNGESYYFNANTPTLIGQVGVFHYAFDLSTDLPAPQSSVFSSQTSGIRIDGRYHRDPYGIDWEASFARQTDFSDNPLDYEADYWLAGLQAFAGPASLKVRFESLGAADQQSFQTPLGTLHKFQGAADLFLNTPPEGLQDIQIKWGWNFGRNGPFRNISTALSVHRFESEVSGLHFGDEINFDITAAFGQFNLALTAANYDAKAFASDTNRFFLSLTHRF